MEINDRNMKDILDELSKVVSDAIGLENIIGYYTKKTYSFKSDVLTITLSYHEDPQQEHYDLKQIKSDAYNAAQNIFGVFALQDYNANFKLREGMIVGAKVTLRGDRMYEFLERLSRITLPRIRDFRGIPGRGFDGRGNYTFGLKDQTTFPEIDATQVPCEKGMDITICTTGDDKSARALLEMLGVPFAGRKSK